MVQAENIQAALEMCGVLDLGKIPRRDMETHADVDYIYVEEPTGAVIDPVITRGTTPEQKHVTVLHNFADRFVASQKPLPPEDYAILEQAVQEEFDKCEKEPEICKAIYYHIKHGIDDSSDLMDCYEGLEVHRLIEKFFATYFPVATVTIIAFDKDYDISFITGDVRVSIGDDKNMNEKVQMAAKLLSSEEMAGRKGTLHIENYQEGKELYYFKND
jgi:hypothetical protein